MELGYWDRVKGNALNEARGTQGGLYFKPGNYLVQVQYCKMIKTQQQHEAFVAEFKIVATDQNDPNLQVGAEPSYFVDMDGKYPDLALGNVADFIRAGLVAASHQAGDEAVPSVDDIELTTDIGKAVTGEENLLAGTFLHAYAFNKPTREGKDFTRFRWRIPESTVSLMSVVPVVPVVPGAPVVTA